MQKHTSVLIKSLTIAVVVILVALPFHAFMTVWASQAIGHYTALRLWKEYLLAVMAFAGIGLVIRDKSLRDRLRRSKLAWVIGLYGVLQLIEGIVALNMQHVTRTALLYGWLSDSRYLIFFILVWIIALRAPGLYSRWPSMIFVPAAVVVTVGLLQYFVFPYDILSHFGYSSATIYPYEDINHNTHYIRIMSTLRGANPLGAYMVLLLSLLTATIVRGRTALVAAWTKQHAAVTLFFTLMGVFVLVLTFSRGAWIGVLISLAVLVWASIRSKQARLMVAAGVLVVALLATGGVFAARNNTFFQNVFFHTQTHSLVATTSNAGHASALRQGLHDLLHEPFGRGPGTAGPASVYNTGHQVRIAENYFIQIGQETGWLGLALFLIIQVLAARALWRRRDHVLSVGLLAALAGISVVGLLSHVWTDDTLAYLWWGLAAIAIAQPLFEYQVQDSVDALSHRH